MNTPAPPTDPQHEALDAYSRLVVGVAERLSPSVANLRVTRRTRGGRVGAGEGSAVALTADGFLAAAPRRALHPARRHRGGGGLGRAGSPAQRAGLRPEDLIVELAGRPVTGVGDLQRLMVADLIGRPVEVVLLRGGETRRLELVPTELKLE